MPGLRAFVSGPGRATAVLSVTQILSWGILVYPPVLILPHVAAARGWSLAFCMAGFSLALVTSGLLSPTIGGLIDRVGGNIVMSVGALAGATGMLLLSMADTPAIYFTCWLLLGAAMSSTLYDPAFTTLTRIFGASARRQITFVTFAGGFASTVGWPATHLLLQDVGWRGTFVAFAIVLALVVAPLHAFALPRIVAAVPPVLDIPETPKLTRPLLPHGRPFILLAAAFAIHAFILSGVTSNLLAMLTRGGIAPATVVAIGAMFGPAQVASRLVDFMFAGKTHPLWIARAAIVLMASGLAMLAFVGMSFATAATFAIAFGAANGVMTIARGALPLLMFGPTGYGRVLGRIARPALFVQALAPFVVTAAIEHFSDRAVLETGIVAALIAFGCLLGLRPHRAVARPGL